MLRGVVLKNRVDEDPRGFVRHPDFKDSIGQADRVGHGEPGEVTLFSCVDSPGIGTVTTAPGIVAGPGS